MVVSLQGGAGGRMPKGQFTRALPKGGLLRSRGGGRRIHSGVAKRGAPTVRGRGEALDLRRGYVTSCPPRQVNDSNKGSNGPDGPGGGAGSGRGEYGMVVGGVGAWRGLALPLCRSLSLSLSLSVPLSLLPLPPLYLRVQWLLNKYQ